MNTIRSRVVVALACAALNGTVHAAPACRAVSAALTRPLIELYTSEGCDSCPPADRWLAQRFAAPSDAHGIAIALHVDYWDRLGWVDRFASAANTERQYAAMRANRASFVYTPQVLLQGHDFPGWRNDAVDAIDAAARAPARATLALEATTSARSVVVTIDAAVPDPALRGDADLFVVYADSGLRSDVRAGENRGRQLAHEHVVRELMAAGRVDANGRIRATLDIARPREAGNAPMLVAFVQRRSNGDVLQTLRLSLDSCPVP